MGDDYMKAEAKSPRTILDKVHGPARYLLPSEFQEEFRSLLKLIADEATKHVDAGHHFYPGPD